MTCKILLCFQVSLLLKDSFIDSFPSKDRSFIKVTCNSFQRVNDTLYLLSWALLSCNSNPLFYHLSFVLQLRLLQLLVDTQMFTVLSDSRLSSFENGSP